MSHKQAKQERKNEPVQLVITLTQERGIECSFPTNIQLAMTMLGEALKIIGAHCTFEAPSPIIAAPPGLRLP
jgi:hypothetical protein